MPTWLVFYHAPQRSGVAELLYDIFDDQRNITRILHTATDEYQMYYSVAGASETHVSSTAPFSPPLPVTDTATIETRYVSLPESLLP